MVRKEQPVVLRETATPGVVHSAGVTAVDPETGSWLRAASQLTEVVVDAYLGFRRQTGTQLVA